MNRSGILLLYILFLGCKEKQNFPIVSQEHNFIRDPYDSLILKYYQDNSDLSQSFDHFYKDSISDQYAFLSHYYKEFDTYYYKDSLKYTVYNGHNGYGRGYLLVVVNFKDIISILLFDKHFSHYEEEVIGSELTRMLPGISEDKYYLKNDITARIIHKLMLSLNWFRHFQIEDTTKLKNKSLEIQNWYADKKLNQDDIEINHSKYFWKRWNSIQDSIINFRHPGNPTNKYIIYTDEYLKIYILGITEDKITYEFFNPTNYRHLYL
ncbi:MAG: hypothetical protein IPI50_10125 [Saprospiraceae bacterium]|nr:hypothetical protein [Saprospiraceae bacterium]